MRRARASAWTRHICSGRPGRSGEVVLLNSFAQANGLGAGDRLSVNMNGARRDFRIVGLAQSPEFLYSTPPGELYPDDRRFGVIWLSRSALAAAYDMDGAFNEVLLAVSRTANVDAVLDAVDRVLDPADYLSAELREACEPAAAEPALCEIRLSGALLSYADHVGYGRLRAPEVDPNWHIPQQQAPLSGLLAAAAAAPRPSRPGRARRPTQCRRPPRPWPGGEPPTGYCSPSSRSRQGDPAATGPRETAGNAASASRSNRHRTGSRPPRRSHRP